MRPRSTSWPLTLERPAPDHYTIDGDIAEPGEPESSDAAGEEGIQGTLLIAGSPELRDAILAKVVDKYADPRYWEKWADTIREISARHEARIRALVGGPDPAVRATFEQFLAGIRNNLNDGITEDDAISMLSQHLVSRPVFDALFEDYAFTALNPVSRGRCRTRWTAWSSGGWKRKLPTWITSTGTCACVCRG